MVMIAFVQQIVPGIVRGTSIGLSNYPDQARAGVARTRYLVDEVNLFPGRVGNGIRAASPGLVAVKA